MDSGIVRNKLKILSAINNAKKFIEVQNEFESFSEYLWKFTNNKIVCENWDNSSDVPTTTQLSDKISKDLKKDLNL